MGFNCVVCVKQVPGAGRAAGGSIASQDAADRSRYPADMNPGDLHALEAALAIRDEHGGSVTAIAMGSSRSCGALREALYLGADRAILVADRRAAGSDTLATGYVLGAAIRRLNPDIVFCGHQSVEGEISHVGPQIAHRIDFTPLTMVDRPVEIDGRTVSARRDTGAGWELVSTELPVLITVTDEANTPRPPAARRMMKFKKALCRQEVEELVSGELPGAGAAALEAEADRRCSRLETRGILIQSWSLDDIGADPSRCGSEGSPTKVHRVQNVVLKESGRRLFENSDEGISALVAELIRDHTIG
jgi:electron transfer flavoprotein beta subunit